MNRKDWADEWRFRNWEDWGPEDQARLDEWRLLESLGKPGRANNTSVPRDFGQYAAMTERGRMLHHTFHPFTTAKCPIPRRFASAIKRYRRFRSNPYEREETIRPR